MTTKHPLVEERPLPNDQSTGKVVASRHGPTLWAAALFAVTLGFARLSYGLLIPALQATFGGGVAQYGVIGTLNFIGYLLGTLAVPLLLARFANQARLNLVIGLLLGLSIMASALSPSLGWITGWRALIGVLSAAPTVLTLTLTLERTPAAARGRVAGVVWAGGAAGIALSGMLAPLVLGGPANGWRWVWLAMGALALVAVAGFRRALGSTVPAAPTPGQPLRLVVRLHAFWQTLGPLMQPRQLLLLLLAYTCFGAGYIIYFTYLVAALVALGVPATATGLIWSALGLAGLVSGVLWGRAIDRWPSGWTLALALAAGAAGAALVLSGQTWVIALGAGMVGLAAFIGPPLMVTALLRRAVTPAAYPTALSVATALFASGQIIGPLLGAWVSGGFGLPAGVALSAVLLAGGALLAAGFGRIQRG